MELLGKELKVVATSNWEGSLPNDQVSYFLKVIIKALQENPYDMLVVEHKEGKLQVRLAGYPLEGHDGLNETKVVYTEDTKPFETVWAKVDDQGDFYLCTVLLPSDY